MKEGGIGMKNGMMKGLITGAVIGGSAAMMYGIMNWQSARQMNHQMKKTGHWLADKTGDFASKF